MSSVAEEKQEAPNEAEGETQRRDASPMLSFTITTPTGEKFDFPQLVPANETVAYIRQSLQELQETCFYSNYKLECEVGGETVAVSDYVELNHYLASNVKVNASGVEEIHTHFDLTIVPEAYDAKRARAAMKRTRDMLKFPPMATIAAADAAKKATKALPAAKEEPSVAVSTATLSEEEQQKAKDEAAAEKEVEAEAKLRARMVAQGEKVKASGILDVTKMLQEVARVDKFYDEALLRGVTAATDAPAAAPATGGASSSASSGNFQLYQPHELIRCICLSGFNPPPPARRMQGDIMYIEVQLGGGGASDAEARSHHITVVTDGFFVNKSTNKVFDPSPAVCAGVADGGFSHELFHCLLKASPLLQKSWAVHVTDVAPAAATPSKPETDGQADEEEEPFQGVFNIIAKYYSQGRGDELSMTPSWLVPPQITLPTASAANGAVASSAVVSSSRNGSVHTYDISRVQDELADSSGVEEKGAQREWNEEIQQVRDMPAEELQQRITRARFMHKLTFEFSEACKAGVAAIADGFVAPMNPMEDERTWVFMFNSVFYSRAYDTKESVRLCVGDEACRKAATQDLRNQKLLAALGVDGLSTVLCTVVDYRGDRYTCQSIVPGVFQTGEGAARLMYGVLEYGKRITVKNSSLGTMGKVGNSLYLAKRNVPIVPVPMSEEAAAAAAEAEEAELDAQMPQAVKIDTEDEVEAADAGKTIPHVGPLECKLLKGSDGRTYAMEMVRLTPRDANYVPTAQNGTGNIAPEQLAVVGEDVCSGYILRHELVHQYVAQKVNAKKRDVVMEHLKANGYDEEAPAKAAAAVPKPEPTGDEKKDAEAAAAAAEAAAAASAAAKKVNDEIRIPADLTAGITAESLGFEFNVNCYTTAVPGGSKDAQLTKDEEMIKTLSTHLFSSVLPSVTEQVLKGEIVAHDNAHLVVLLHTMGINMRYLGQLTAAATVQEEKDKETQAKEAAAMEAHKTAAAAASAAGTPAPAPPSSKAREFLPLYWKEMLEIEVVARCVKHMLNRSYRQSKRMATAPARLVAAVLNAVIGTAAKDSQALEESGVKAQAVAAVNNTSADKKSKNKVVKKDKKHAAKQQQVTVSCAGAVGGAAYPVASVGEYRAEVHSEALRRFGAKLTLFSETSGPDTSRISQAALLRRVCQVCGVRVACRDYQFDYEAGASASAKAKAAAEAAKASAEASSKSTSSKAITVPVATPASAPFRVEDVFNVVPVVKTSEADIAFSEARQVLEAGRSHMQQQDFSTAYELTNQAMHWLQQIVGTMHREYLAATNQLTEILSRAGDVGNAIHNSTGCIAAAVQLRGLDCIDTLRCHVQLSSLLHQRKEYVGAVNHLLAAKYLIQLCAGPRHPEVANLYSKLGNMLCEVGGWEQGLRCFEEARERTELSDPTRHLEVCLDLADLLAGLNYFGPAAELQKQSYQLSKMLYGDLPAAEAKLAGIKNTLELYLRTDLEHKKMQQMYMQQAAKMQAEAAAKEAEEEKKAAAEGKIKALLEAEERAKMQKHKGKGGSKGGKKK